MIRKLQSGFGIWEFVCKPVEKKQKDDSKNTNSRAAALNFERDIKNFIPCRFVAAEFLCFTESNSAQNRLIEAGEKLKREKVDNGGHWQVGLIP